ncbi:hypothetical protein KCU88_g136, partial [Aureobasidium melanogenum]
MLMRSRAAFQQLPVHPSVELKSASHPGRAKAENEMHNQDHSISCLPATANIASRGETKAASALCSYLHCVHTLDTLCALTLAMGWDSSLKSQVSMVAPWLITGVFAQHHSGHEVKDIRILVYGVRSVTIEDQGIIVALYSKGRLVLVEVSLAGILETVQRRLTRPYSLIFCLWKIPRQRMSVQSLSSPSDNRPLPHSEQNSRCKMTPPPLSPSSSRSGDRGVQRQEVSHVILVLLLRITSASKPVGRHVDDVIQVSPQPLPQVLSSHLPYFGENGLPRLSEQVTSPLAAGEYEHIRESNKAHGDNVFFIAYVGSTSIPWNECCCAHRPGLFRNNQLGAVLDYGVLCISTKRPNTASGRSWSLEVVISSWVPLLSVSLTNQAQPDP